MLNLTKNTQHDKKWKESIEILRGRDERTTQAYYVENLSCEALQASIPHPSEPKLGNCGSVCKYTPSVKLA